MFGNPCSLLLFYLFPCFCTNVISYNSPPVSHVFLPYSYSSMFVFTCKRLTWIYCKSVRCGWYLINNDRNLVSVTVGERKAKQQKIKRKTRKALNDSDDELCSAFNCLKPRSATVTWVWFPFVLRLSNCFLIFLYLTGVELSKLSLSIKIVDMSIPLEAGCINVTHLTKPGVSRHALMR